MAKLLVPPGRRICSGLQVELHAHLKMGSEEGIAISFLDKLCDLTPEQVMHDARSFLEAMQAGQQNPDGRLIVLWMQSCNGLIAQLSYGREHLRQVTPHVCIWAVPQREIWNLSKCLQPHTSNVS